MRHTYRHITSPTLRHYLVAMYRTNSHQQINSEVLRAWCDIVERLGSVRDLRPLDKSSSDFCMMHYSGHKIGTPTDTELEKQMIRLLMRAQLQLILKSYSR